MVNKKFAGRKSCSVLITCDAPNEEGKMHVEMSYEGDIDLAALMVDHAQSFFDEARNEEVGLESCKNKQISL